MDLGEAQAEKDRVRRAIWDLLERSGLPLRGPSTTGYRTSWGAERAARRLVEAREFSEAKVISVTVKLY